MSHYNALLGNSWFLSLLCFISLCLPIYSKSLFGGGVVVSKNKIASKAGVEVLRKGGNAIDAAVATAYALGVVEPNGSGIGGGGFALVYLAKDKKLVAVDFRERAPKAINDDLHQFRDGPKAGGIPGTVRGLEYLRINYGKLSRQLDMQEAIRLAAEGFPVNKTLHDSINHRQGILALYEDSRKILLPDNKVPEIGQILIQPELANTLKAIAIGGAPEFYEGQTAIKMVSALQKEGGIITLSDLKNYSVYLWKPICGYYRQQYKICSFPPPSSGGVCLIEALNILENFNLPKYDYKAPERLHYVTEALKLSFADRAVNLGDPRYNRLPIRQLTSKEYAKTLAKQIKAESKAISSAKVKPLQVKLNSLPSRFNGKNSLTRNESDSKPASGRLQRLPREHSLKQNTLNEKPETTHFTVIDKDGNIVAITSSLNGGLGSGFVITGTGILLNNTLDDFSLPEKANQYGLLGNNLNSPQPFKTPLSSMSPTIVFDSLNRPILALGSPGGPTIISAVLNTLLAYLDHKMTLSQAVEAGRLHHQWQPDHLYCESSLIDTNNKNTLIQKYGYHFPDGPEAVWSHFYWSVQAIDINWKTLTVSGASDPRTEQGALYE